MTEFGPDGENEPQVWVVGGPVSRTTVGLTFSGDTLDPGEITKLLGHEPTRCGKKGEVRRADARRTSYFITGIWSLDSPLPEGELDKKILAVLRLVTPDREAWQRITSRFHGRIFAGVFLGSFNQGFGLSPAVMAALAERGLSFDADIYAVGEDEPQDGEAGSS